MGCFGTLKHARVYSAIGLPKPMYINRFAPPHITPLNTTPIPPERSDNFPLRHDRYEAPPHDIPSPLPAQKSLITHPVASIGATPLAFTIEGFQGDILRTIALLSRLEHTCTFFSLVNGRHTVYCRLEGKEQ
jgi:hypothetical protein